MDQGQETTAVTQLLLRDWNDPYFPTAGPSNAAPPSAFPSSTSLSFAQRRRSSAAHIPPAGPPPNQPIPNTPGTPTIPSNGHVSGRESTEEHAMHVNGRGTRSSSFIRATLSSSPTSKPAGSQPQKIPPPNTSSSQTDSTMEDLSDPPPQSFLYSTSSHVRGSQEKSGTDRLSPREGRERRESRVLSSRRALTRALELAREAVQLDSRNDNPEAAVYAYGQSVALLSEVMERVRRGEDSTESRSRRRQRSLAAQEEEVRRLQNIHDTYADRMNILSIIYSIPPMPYTNPSSFRDSSTSISPTTSTSPSSDSPLQEVSQGDTYAGNGFHYQDPVSPSDIFPMDDSGLSRPSSDGLPITSQHPYANPYDSAIQEAPLRSIAPGTTNNRASIISRKRATSTLPPPVPPPPQPLPPAPVFATAQPVDGLPSGGQTDARTRQRGESLSHRRTGSNGLDALPEEQDSDRFGQPKVADADNTHFVPDSTHNDRDSHPLPPLPSPSLSGPGTARNVGSTLTAPSPSMPNLAAPKPRVPPSSTHSENLTSTPLINATPDQGTILKRRNKAPASSRSSSPAESMASAGSASQPRSAASSLPVLPPKGPATGRSRSSSQPDGRPSLVGDRIPPSGERPPLPNAGPINGLTIRKTSVPTKLTPNLSQLSIQTNLSSGPGFNSSLVPSLTIPGALPTTPTSPLPPVPPSDPLLKPYHMMNLLRNTMTSPTGGYLTRRLHVPHEVWSQGGAKLSNVPEKVRVVAILCSALEELQVGSSEYFGAGNVSSGLAMGIGSIGRKEADGWLAKLEEFSAVCDGVVTNFGKKLGVGEGFVLKKAIWTDKFRFPNGKNLDSPTAYVRDLEKLFLHTQLLDEHTKAVLCQPPAPAYAAFPADVRHSAEQKLKRASEFFATVVLTFVVRDLSQLLDKYAKKCEKWLAE